MNLLTYMLICAAGPHEHALAFEEFYNAPTGGFDQETVLVVADAESFGGLWGQVMGYMMDKPAAVPQVDFDSWLVVAYFPGTRPTLGYRFEIKGLFLLDGKKPTLVLMVTETGPKEVAAQMISRPVVMLKVSRADARGWWEKDFKVSIEK